MEIQYSIIQNSTGDGFNAVVLRSWYVDEDGNQITIKADAKAGLTLQECSDLCREFLNETNINNYA